MHDLSIMSRMGCRAAWADSTRGYSAGQHVQHEQHGHGSIYMESGTVGPHARAFASHAMPDCCEASSSGNTNIIQIAPGTVYIYNPYTCPHTQGGTCSEPTLRVAWAVGQHGLLYKLCYRSHFGPRHNLRLCIPSVRAWGHIVCRSRRWRRRSDGPRGR